MPCNYKAGFLPIGASAGRPVVWTFRHASTTVLHMDKAEHGHRLKVAMSRAGRDRGSVADALNVSARTVTNWTSGNTMPTTAQRDALRKILGAYDDDGDPVEAAVRSSALVEWRQDTVIGFYKRHLHEQREEATG